MATPKKQKTEGPNLSAAAAADSLTASALLRCVTPHASPGPDGVQGRLGIALGRNDRGGGDDDDDDGDVDDTKHGKGSGDSVAVQVNKSNSANPRVKSSPKSTPKGPKLTIAEMKNALRRNGQHVTGKKAVLLERIEDGETYGRLAPCPECDEGRLKVLEGSPSIIFCPGHYESDGYGGYVVSCGYNCLADEAPRSGGWVGPRLVVGKAEAAPSPEEVRAHYKKMRVPQLKAVLEKNGQHVSGKKNALLDRLVDGHINGPLDACPICLTGRLKVNEACPTLVTCSGHYDGTLHIHIPCYFRCATKDAPRAGTWKK